MTAAAVKPLETPGDVTRLARAALAVLAAGARDGDGWTVAAERDGVRFRLRLTGPDLPADIPAALAAPELIQAQPHWRPRYTLQVRAPLIAFELMWTPEDPLRIVAFSRGDWEAVLTAWADERGGA
jgi:hypothetical protein